MYEALVFAYGRKLNFGEFYTEFDAKIACERHAGIPLQWRIYASHDHGFYANAGKRLYIVRPATESDAQ